MSDIRNAEELAVVLSEKLDDDAPLNLHSRWRPLAAELWARMGLPDRLVIRSPHAARPIYIGPEGFDIPV